MGPNGPRSELIYIVGMGYEGRIGCTFTFVHKGVLAIMQGCIGHSLAGKEKRRLLEVSFMRSYGDLREKKIFNLEVLDLKSLVAQFRHFKLKIGMTFFEFPGAKHLWL